MVPTELPPLARRVKVLREAAGMSQQQLAMSAGLSMSMIGLIEQGQRENPRGQTLLAIAKALGVTVDALLTDAGQAEVTPAKKKGKGKK
jgi:transcriptional regulator with XRE-family HTH domain